MKDSGCQPHCIKTEIAERLNLPIVESEFSVLINGFNESKNYLTKIVQVDMEINSRLYSVNAICIPEIKIKMFLPGLSKLIKTFVAKGYTMADSFLNNCTDNICDLEFVLGTNDPHVLPERHVLFGEPNPSVFSETPAGIMLMGNVCKVQANMGKLQNIFNNFTCTEQLADLNIDGAGTSNSDPGYCFGC